ncbi:hypothetical protein AB0H87_41270, partial [Asanoa sp. NPDC050611]
MTQSTDLVSLARALAAGEVPGTIQVSRRASGAAGPYAVRHALDRAGSPLLLVAVDSPADRALTGPDEASTTTARSPATCCSGRPSGTRCCSWRC